MRFLAKRQGSPLADMKYREGGHNDTLLAALLDEQRGFCAYTEKRVSRLDTCAVEHFDPDLKSTPEDGYLNYYAVLQSANQYKRRTQREHRGARFFTTRFFQEPGGFARRLQYVVEEHAYSERDPGDEEARDLIDFLGFNNDALVEERRRHVRRVLAWFTLAELDVAQRLQLFRDHPEELSFITALVAALDLDLDSLTEPASAASASPAR